jgi:hypothetical protein
MLRVALLPALDGARPSGTLEWVSAAVPLLPGPRSGPGTGPPAAGSGPWQRGQALLVAARRIHAGIVRASPIAFEAR